MHVNDDQQIIEVPPMGKPQRFREALGRAAPYLIAMVPCVAILLGTYFYISSHTGWMRGKQYIFLKTLNLAAFGILVICLAISLIILRRAFQITFDAKDICEAYGLTRICTRPDGFTKRGIRRSSPSRARKREITRIFFPKGVNRFSLVCQLKERPEEAIFVPYGSSKEKIRAQLEQLPEPLKRNAIGMQRCIVSLSGNGLILQLTESPIGMLPREAVPPIKESVWLTGRGFSAHSVDEIRQAQFEMAEAQLDDNFKFAKERSSWSRKKHQHRWQGTLAEDITLYTSRKVIQ
ncbi:hypothetical protein [Bifidobacterium sp. ESL0745]|uniref:hypothetical protein n=1 Tax=Bifidobacterium sp. ESL0745 TaxID=2983226 RepID=UPI0023F9C842|nr:hypothetical protein [Bifidobacterium sp. ESL0745]MDF7665662.1 hypothetical protein [Bifidobacterium sp. ESL0745]